MGTRKAQIAARNPQTAAARRRSSITFVVLRCIAADVIPRRLRADEDVLLDLDAGIAVDAAERHAVNDVTVPTAQRGAAGAAEREAPSGCGLVASDVVGAARPRERTRLDLGVSRPRSAERLAASRAV